MIIDSSALVAMLLREDDHLALTHAMNNADSRKISAATLLETNIVVDRRTDHETREQFATYLDEAFTEVVPFNAEQAAIARRAYERFGKGSGHRAGLNFGDCFAYALAKETGEPLLFKGDDFSHTDIVPAL